MGLQRDDLKYAVVSRELRTVLESENPAELTRGGVVELFFICACIDDPKETGGVDAEIDYDSDGAPTRGEFHIASFDLNRGKYSQADFLRLIEQAQQSQFTNDYDERTEDGVSYTVVQFRTTWDDPGPAGAIVAEVCEAGALAKALEQSLHLTAVEGDTLTTLRSYCLAVLANLLRTQED